MQRQLYLRQELWMICVGELQSHNPYWRLARHEKLLPTLFEFLVKVLASFCIFQSSLWQLHLKLFIWHPKNGLIWEWSMGRRSSGRASSSSSLFLLRVGYGAWSWTLANERKLNRLSLASLRNWHVGRSCWLLEHLYWINLDSKLQVSRCWSELLD